MARATAAMEDYEPAAARAAIERFFWSDFCDTYLELVKFRLSGRTLQDPETDTASGRAAAVYTLRTALLAVLKLLAPFLPHVTEEIYLQGFASDEGAASIHLAHWPDAAAFPEDPAAKAAGEAMLAVVEAVRRWKSERALSVGAPIGKLEITCPPETVPLLQAMRLDLATITRAAEVTVRAGETVAARVAEPEREAPRL